MVRFFPIAGFGFILALSLAHSGAADEASNTTNTTRKDCSERAIDRCRFGCDEEFPHDSDSEEVRSGWERCSRTCDRGCDPGSSDEASVVVLLGVVAFIGIFSCTGTGLISGSLMRSKLEKAMRKHYRENGEKTQGIVVSKTTRTVSAGDSGSRTVYNLGVDVQTEVNGQQLRATKDFRDIEAGIYNSLAQGGPIPVTSIVRLTGDPRHFMLSAYADSDSKGMVNRAAIGCFGGIFACAGLAGSLGLSLSQILPDDIAFGIIGVIISLLCAIGPIPLARARVKKVYDNEEASPSGSQMAPRTAVEMANMQQMGQPIVLQPGMVMQQPGMGTVVQMQQPGMGTVVQMQQPGMGTVVQQPGVVMGQKPGVAQVQPVFVVQQQQPQPTPVLMSNP
jgi:hypothetical protein